MAYNADKKPGELTALTSLATDDLIIVGDTSDVSEVAKSITKANLEADLTPALADTVTTNANLTGHVTSTGNAAVLGSFTKAQLDTAVSDDTILYDSELTSIADVKALDQSVVSGAAPVFAATNMTDGTDKNFISDAEAVVLGNTSGTNTGDQTSIVGITGTKAQFDTAVTDGNIMYIGDAPTAHTHLLAAGATDVTATAAEVNLLDGVTATTAELNYVDGVTSNVQTQLDAKLANLSEDTTPQLGGELDAGANSIGFTMQTATGDGTTTVDWGNGNHFDFTFGAFNETFTFTAPAKSGVYTMSLKQDSVGSRTATWPASVKWPAGTAPTLTTTATTGYDICSFRYDGTNYYAVATLNFS